MLSLAAGKFAVMARLIVLLYILPLWVRLATGDARMEVEEVGLEIERLGRHLPTVRQGFTTVFDTGGKQAYK